MISIRIHVITIFKKMTNFDNYFCYLHFYNQQQSRERERERERHQDMTQARIKPETATPQLQHYFSFLLYFINNLIK